MCHKSSIDFILVIKPPLQRKTSIQLTEIMNETSTKIVQPYLYK